MMLETAGFAVLLAEDGGEALKILYEHKQEISAVLLDLTMPHMDGIQTFREIRRIVSGMPVILSSGYNEQDATSHFAGKGLAGFIQKPYEMKSLVEILGNVLTRRS